MCDLEPFDGNLDNCQGLLLQCGLVVCQRPTSSVTEAAQIRYVLGLLRGRALAWEEAASSHEDFCTLFLRKDLRLFDHPNNGGNATDHRLKQGAWSVSDFAVEVWTGC